MIHLPNAMFKEQAELAIEDARAAIAESLRLIADQEDRPNTMRCQIKEIDERVDDIERRVSALGMVMDRWEEIATRLEQQRDEALRQRDLLMAVIEQLHATSEGQ
jgi:septal ring factor EnvC (AmiA/AmiB activator)